MNNGNSSTLQLNQKISHTQYALNVFLLLLASKACTLPLVTSELASSKAIWVVAVLAVIDIIVLIFSTAIARQGGVFNLPIKHWIKCIFCVLFFVFFFLKLASFAREISTYFALSLFENLSVLPIVLLLLGACCLGASKGFAGIARVVEIFIWVFVGVFFFVVIFTRTSGNAFNVLAILNPDFDGFGTALLKSIGWFGDVIIIAFMDIRGKGLHAVSASTYQNGDAASASSQTCEQTKTETKHDKIKRLKLLIIPSCAALALMLIFYAVFISVYGDTAYFTNFAFIKLSTFRANNDELGSADWPVIILWSIVSCFYLGLLLCASKECVRSVVKLKEGNNKVKYFIFAIVSFLAAAFGVLFINNEDKRINFMQNVMSYVSIGAMILTIVLGIISMVKEKQNEKSSA